jgi:N-acetyl-gamma-glutamyl-phosphate reductase
MKRFKAAVIGGSGYGANELIRRLLLHPDVELARVTSIDHVGAPLSAAHPNLEGQSELRFENLDPEVAAEGMDVVLLALPHKIAASYVARLVRTRVPRILDLSGDYRLADPAAYERFYGQPHPNPELLGTAVYGLPEHSRRAIAEARVVASPGCFATTIELGLLPVARAGLLRGHVRTVAITGSSGSGAAASAATHHPVRAQNLKTYKPLVHQHVPEILQLLASAGAPSLELEFVPVSAPLTRGIFATSFVTVPASLDEAAVADVFGMYRHELFVRVPNGRLPEVAAVSGSNYVEVGYTLGAAHGDSRTLVVMSALDNLIKGGAGQAIQSMNLMLGVDETTTLKDPGGYP